jgi:hypothetical protein
LQDDGGKEPLIIDVRAEDIAALLATGGVDVKTALDRILASNLNGNGFNNCVG